FPPGNSHQPGQGLSPGRSASNSAPSARKISPAATWMMGLDIASRPVACKLTRHTARAGPAFKRPLQRLGARRFDIGSGAAVLFQPVIDNVEIVVLLEGVERQPKAKAF